MTPSPPQLQMADFNTPADHGPAAARRRKNAWMSQRLGSILLITLGLTWGGITACSMAIEDWETKIQAAALVVALVFGFLSFRESSLLAWLNSVGGIILTVHVAAAVVSGFQSDVPSEHILRYAALLPAFSVLLSVARAGFQSVEKVRLGLTIAGLVFVVFHLTELDYASLTDPMYRISVYLNPNSTAFIASMISLSAAGWALRPNTRSWVRVFWFAAVLCCAVLLLGTKSRTAFLALAAGTLAYSWIRFHTLPARIATIAVIVLGLAYAFQHRETITDTMSLDEKERSIETGTGRYEIWRFLLTTVIPENPWLGIGPGQHTDLVLAATGSTNSHNGFLTSLADTGIVGTLPLFLLTGLCFRAVWQRRKRADQAWVAAIFAAGVVESLGESVFFSIGNPASLLFMLAVATLATRSSPETAPDPVPAPTRPHVPDKLVLRVVQ